MASTPRRRAPAVMTRATQQQVFPPTPAPEWLAYRPIVQTATCSEFLLARDQRPKTTKTKHRQFQTMFLQWARDNGVSGLVNSEMALQCFQEQCGISYEFTRHTVDAYWGSIRDLYKFQHAMFTNAIGTATSAVVRQELMDLQSTLENPSQGDNTSLTSRRIFKTSVRKREREEHIDPLQGVRTINPVSDDDLRATQQEVMAARGVQMLPAIRDHCIYMMGVGTGVRGDNAVDVRYVEFAMGFRDVRDSVNHHTTPRVLATVMDHSKTNQQGRKDQFWFPPRHPDVRLCSQGAMAKHIIADFHVGHRTPRHRTGLVPSLYYPWYNQRRKIYQHQSNASYCKAHQNLSWSCRHS